MASSTPAGCSFLCSAAHMWTYDLWHTSCASWLLHISLCPLHILYDTLQHVHVQIPKLLGVFQSGFAMVMAAVQDTHVKMLHGGSGYEHPWAGFCLRDHAFGPQPTRILWLNHRLWYLFCPIYTSTVYVCESILGNHKPYPVISTSHIVGLWVGWFFFIFCMGTSEYMNSRRGKKITLRNQISWYLYLCFFFMSLSLPGGATYRAEILQDLVFL